jgi:hypothetical protein
MQRKALKLTWMNFLMALKFVFLEISKGKKNLVCLDWNDLEF